MIYFNYNKNKGIKIMEKYYGIQSYQDDCFKPYDSSYCEICGRFNCYLFNRDGNYCEEMKQLNYTDLGDIELWDKIPNKYNDCINIEEHKYELDYENNTYKCYICHECKIEWLVKK